MTDEEMKHLIIKELKDGASCELCRKIGIAEKCKTKGCDDTLTEFYGSVISVRQGK